MASSRERVVLYATVNARSPVPFSQWLIRANARVASGRQLETNICPKYLIAAIVHLAIRAWRLEMNVAFGAKTRKWQKLVMEHVELAEVRALILEQD